MCHRDDWTTLGQQHLLLSLQGCIVEEGRDDDEEEQTFSEVQEHGAVRQPAGGSGSSVLLFRGVLNRGREQTLTLKPQTSRFRPSARLHLFTGPRFAACGLSVSSPAHFQMKPRINLTEKWMKSSTGLPGRPTEACEGQSSRAKPSHGSKFLWLLSINSLNHVFAGFMVFEKGKKHKYYFIHICNIGYV